MRQLYTFHGGVHPPENKDCSNQAPIAMMPLAPVYHVPLNQHLGLAAKPCVKIGDRVLKGQMIARANGQMSAAIHAPTSGRVIAIDLYDYAHPSNLPEKTISIETDYQDEWQAATPLDNWPNLEDKEIRQFLREMGVVGQGGAVFPTSLKLGVSTLDQLIINGVECEPYITCDDRLMRERAKEIVAGIKIIANLLQPKEILIGLEDNKPEAIAAMQAACQENTCEVVTIPTLYPSGGAKQLIKILTDKSIPHGVRSTQMGVQSFNVGTVYSVYEAVVHGRPVISRIVTLTGAVNTPQNVEALIGTPIEFLMAHAGMPETNKAVVMGGPMMGFELPSLKAGVIKACNCLIAKSTALFPPAPPAMPCIRCGECSQVCPMELQPMDLYWFAKTQSFEKSKAWQLFDCIECGACDYVCPSNIPLTDYFKFSKSEIRAQEKDQKAAERAKMRHEFKQTRIERDKAEKAERLAARASAKVAAAVPYEKPAPKPSVNAAPVSDDSKRAAIEAAMARAAAKKAAQQSAETEPAKPAPAIDDAKRAAIEAAMARAAAKKSAQQSAETEPAKPAPAIDDAKRAAIEAAMARAAAKKAAQQSAETEPAKPAPAIDDAKRAAIEAAMARATAKKAAREKPEQPDGN